MNEKQLEALQDIKSVELGMKWHGWGSPIGLSIFILSLTLTAVVIKLIFFN